jgi:hypothetical protein
VSPGDEIEKLPGVKWFTLRPSFSFNSNERRDENWFSDKEAF